MRLCSPDSTTAAAVLDQTYMYCSPRVASHSTGLDHIGWLWV
uniref:Uncharacterized protein n=1 Tax=Anguilla anguilla TaxID=7936 RepID=A0A0E9WSI9_ANGAN